MTDEFGAIRWFDFNEGHPSLRFLGGPAAAAVEDAAVMLAKPNRPPAADVAALRALSLALPKLIELAGADAKAKEAFALLDGALRRAEENIAASIPGEAGRPRGDYEKQARAVIALEWLENLQHGPALSPGAAQRAVLDVISEGPSRLARAKAMDDLGKWRRDFGPLMVKSLAVDEAHPAPEGGTANDARLMALKNIRFEIWEQFFDEWHEIIGETPNTDRKAGEPESLPIYSEECKGHDWLDMSPATILDWLKKSFEDQ